MMSLFAVFQDAYAQDWQLAARILVDALGLHPTTAKRHARRSGGFLAENLEPDVAERLRQACFDGGMAVHVIAQDEAVVLPKPLRVHSLGIAEEALWICQSPAAPRAPVGWESLLLIAAHHLQKTETYLRWRITPDTSREDGTELRVESRVRNSPEYLADLVASSADGSLLRLRLWSRELNYQQALGVDLPDPRHTPNARLESFRLVLARIHARASRAHVPRETLALLGGVPDPERPPHDLPTLEEFDAYNRWLLQKTRLEG
jgi:hypothetical protein